MDPQIDLRCRSGLCSGGGDSWRTKVHQMSEPAGSGRPPGGQRLGRGNGRAGWAGPQATAHAAYRVSKAGERQGLNRDEFYVDLGRLRKCVQVVGI
jgi:hypothetical protein